MLKSFGGRFVIQSLPRTLIQSSRHGIKFGLRINREIGSLREVLAFKNPFVFSFAPRCQGCCGFALKAQQQSCIHAARARRIEVTQTNSFHQAGERGAPAAGEQRDRATGSRTRGKRQPVERTINGRPWHDTGHWKSERSRPRQSGAGNRGNGQPGRRPTKEKPWRPATPRSTACDRRNGLRIGHA